MVASSSTATLITASVAAVLLTACRAVGPDYKVPDAAVIQQPAARAPFAGASQPQFSPEDPPDTWWRLFQDATLDDLIRSALLANTDLRAASANIGRADAALRQAKAARLPATTLEATPAYALLSAEQYLVQGPLPSLWEYDAGLNVSWQLDLAGQLRRGIEAAGADSDAARAARDVARITVAAETARAYAQACAAGRAIAVAERSVELQRNSAALAERLYHGGRGITLDVTRATAQVDQLRSNLPSLQAEKRLALYRLAVLTGNPPTAFPAAAQQCVADPQLVSALPVGDGASLLRRRPDIRQAERNLAAATARIGFVTADLYPKVVLGVSGGSTGVASNLLHSDTLRYSIGPLISWEFPNRSITHARIAGAEAAAQAALARFDGIVLAALRDIESALTIYSYDLERQQAIDSSRGNAARAADDARRLFEAGRIAYLPVLDAERTLAAADQTRVGGESRLVADEIAIFLALGGGWQTP